MEKQQEVPPGTAPEIDDLKLGPETSVAKDVDLGQMLGMDITPQQERKVLLKLDLILIPLMGICYMMQYMDKLALSQATMFNLREDLNLQGTQYSWSSAVFYFGYFAWSWPSSYLIVRLPIAKYLSASVLVWGGVLMCHAAAKSFGGLMAARFFLGVGEAAIAPGFALITGMYYKREEQPARQAAWFFGNCVSTVIGGVVAYGIGTIKVNAISSWQLLFLFLGAITAAISVFLVILLPDSPQKAIFLTKTERTIAVQRTLKNKTGVMDGGEFKWNQAWLAIRDPQTWFLVLYTFSVNLCNGGVTSFSSIIISGFGFSQIKSLLMQMPLGAAQIVFLVITAGVATVIPNTRILMMIFNTTVSLVGMVLVWKLNEDNQKGRLTGLALGAVFAVNIPLALSIISSNVAGFTKRSTTSALMFVAYCVGNIVGPQFFLASEEPHYPTGMKGAISGLALGAFFLVCLFVYYIVENKRRDSAYGPPTQLTEEEERMQGLSNKTDLEIESFRYVI
ncbi:major facilitator superfamily domain-containing protein [Aspergillus pseudonomiae]|uniref:Major facilitator superfamily domain-containing protein n=1 Tax=Aspergillus pseudonomiae TaxID=1506151 RepID=A0A5N7DVD9_9EURO|nr:major facilitator superfamily domain-containing protein [Aspergillus pseudonomiae]KAB8261275.1 major facilitator superfamily domain-containing protein [Aspergillus pseudonomiae]KAE8410009.1 major facilitator superfamily domain-containing protein [Aspergillus pseudonomiae]